MRSSSVRLAQKEKLSFCSPNIVMACPLFLLLKTTLTQFSVYFVIMRPDMSHVMDLEYWIVFEKRRIYAKIHFGPQFYFFKNHRQPVRHSFQHNIKIHLWNKLIWDMLQPFFIVYINCCSKLFFLVFKVLLFCRVCHCEKLFWKVVSLNLNVDFWHANKNLK